MINAGIHHPDGIILDLEDAVAPDRKYEARFLVRNALRQLDFYGAERMVRINQVPRGLDDLEYLVPHNINLILVPKCESSEQIQQVNDRIRQINDRLGISSQIWLMPIIESALGVVKAYEIATKNGLKVVRNLIGPYITSLEMAGMSITLLKMDDDLLKLWDFPVKTPGMRWGM